MNFLHKKIKNIFNALRHKKLYSDTIDNLINDKIEEFLKINNNDSSDNKDLSKYNIHHNNRKVGDDNIITYRAKERTAGFVIPKAMKFLEGDIISPKEVINNHINKVNKGYYISELNKNNKPNEELENFINGFIDEFINTMIINKNFSINGIMQEFINGNNLSRDINYPMVDIRFKTFIDEKIIHHITKLLYIKNEYNIKLFNFVNDHELIRVLIKNGYGVTCYIGGLMGVENYYDKDIEILLNIYPIATDEMIEHAPTGKECTMSNDVIFYICEDEWIRLFTDI